MKVLGVITARGGSKGIPGKNIKLLGGQPLIAYTIRSAKKSKIINDLIVSTDYEEISAVAREYGAGTPFLRPSEIASDKTPHVPVMQHAIKFMEENKKTRYDLVVILQPTSPFRTPEDIDETLALLIQKNADSAVSLVEVEGGSHPMKMKKLEHNRVMPYCMEEMEGTRRQDLPPVYKRSGAVYAMRRDLIMNDARLYGDHIVGHIVPKERSVDIDHPVDWLIAEYKLDELKKQGYEF